MMNAPMNEAQKKAMMQQQQARQGTNLAGPVAPGINNMQVPSSPNQMQQQQPSLQEQAYRNALVSMSRFPKPLPIAMSTTPDESPVIDAADNVSEIVPSTEQQAVQIVEDEDSRDNLTRNPSRSNNPKSGMNYP
jgi:hypothetical protein